MRRVALSAALLLVPIAAPDTLAGQQTAPVRLAEVVDSAAAAPAIAALWPEAGRAGSATFVVRFDSAGVLEMLRPARSDLPEGVVARVRAALEGAAVVRSGTEKRSGYARLDVELRDPGTVRITAAKPRFDAPRLLNRQDVTRAFAQMLGSRRFLFEARIKALVEENGKLSRVEVEQSSGNAEIDDIAARAVRRGSFEPCTAEGVPLGCWIVLPFQPRRP